MTNRDRTEIGRRRAGALFPLAVADALHELVWRVDVHSLVPLVLDELFVRARGGAGAGVRPAVVAAMDQAIAEPDPRTATQLSFVLAGHQIELLSYCEAAAGLIETGELPRMRVRAIEDWAEMLRFWNVNERGNEIREGVVRMGMTNSYRVNDRAVALLGSLVKEPWEVPRINQLQAGIMDPHRFSSRKGSQEHTLWDPRLIIATELQEQFGTPPDAAFELAADWLETGFGHRRDAALFGVPRLESEISSAGAFGAFVAAREIWRALVGPKGRYAGAVVGDDGEGAAEPMVRIEIVGELLRTPTHDMAANGMVPESAPGAARTRPIREVGFLIQNLYPTLPFDEDVPDEQIFSLATDLRSLVSEWYADPVGSPVNVVEMAPKRYAGTRVDFVIDIPATQDSHAGTVHVWFQEIRHPHEWVTRRLFYTSGPEWLGAAMVYALRRGMVLSPAGLLYGPDAGEMSYHRVPVTRAPNLKLGPGPLRSRDLLEPHVVPDAERSLIQALGLRPQPSFHRWTDEPEVQDRKGPGATADGH